ncbi:MAG: IclR family transcriptional regulator [Rhizobiaceae bacterium]
MGTITKALKLLNYFSIHRAEIGLSEFKALSVQDKATVYRHLCELQENGFIEQDPISKNYRLGPAVLRLATVREQTFPMREAVSTIVDELSRQLGELVHVSLYEGGYMSPLYHADIQPHGTRVYFDEGELLPMHATSSGLAMLAFGGDGILNQLLKAPLVDFTGHTITSPKDIKQYVQRVRDQGYALSEEGFEKEVFSMAVPVFNQGEVSIGTIAVALPHSRLTKAVQEKILTQLKQGGRDVTNVLGGTVPEKLEGAWEDAV